MNHSSLTPHRQLDNCKKPIWYRIQSVIILVLLFPQRYTDYIWPKYDIRFSDHVIKPWTQLRFVFHLMKATIDAIYIGQHTNNICIPRQAIASCKSTASFTICSVQDYACPLYNYNCMSNVTAMCINFQKQTGTNYLLL